VFYCARDLWLFGLKHEASPVSCPGFSSTSLFLGPVWLTRKNRRWKTICITVN
jgi:hypothetical protein